MFAVLSAFEFIEDGVFGEGAEALGADEAMLVPYLTT